MNIFPPYIIIFPLYTIIFSLYMNIFPLYMNICITCLEPDTALQDPNQEILHQRYKITDKMKGKAKFN